MAGGLSLARAARETLLGLANWAEGKNFDDEQPRDAATGQYRPHPDDASLDPTLGGDEGDERIDGMDCPKCGAPTIRLSTTPSGGPPDVASPTCMCLPDGLDIEEPSL